MSQYRSVSTSTYWVESTIHMHKEFLLRVNIGPDFTSHFKWQKLTGKIFECCLVRVHALAKLFSGKILPAIPLYKTICGFRNWPLTLSCSYCCATCTSSLASGVVNTYGVLKVGHYLPASRREEVGRQRTHLLQGTNTPSLHIVQFIHM